MGTVSPDPKNVVIVVDVSLVLSLSQLDTAKELSKQIVSALSLSDKVCIY